MQKCDWIPNFQLYPCFFRMVRKLIQGRSKNISNLDMIFGSLNLLCGKLFLPIDFRYIYVCTGIYGEQIQRLCYSYNKPRESLYSSGNAMTITFTSSYYNYYRGFLIAVQAGTYHMKAFECRSRKELSVNLCDNSQLLKLNFGII